MCGCGCRYSLYVHTAPGFEFESTSLFSGSHVHSESKAVWGTMAMVQVELALLRAAFKRLDNAQFVSSRRHELAG